MFAAILALGLFPLGVAQSNPTELRIVSLAERFGLSPTDTATTDYSGRVENRHLKSVNRNNFIGKTVYSDSSCTTPSQSFGSLVNYCFDLDDANGQSSFLYKMNKKDHTIVQLDYDGYGCKGAIPARITDITSAFPEFTMDVEYGACLMDEWGEYYSVDYLTERPDFMGSYGVLAVASSVNGKGSCNPDKFVDFHWYQSGDCVKVRQGWGMKFSAEDCDTTGDHSCRLTNI